jgi:taurine dioxygenase
LNQKNLLADILCFLNTRFKSNNLNDCSIKFILENFKYVPKCSPSFRQQGPTAFAVFVKRQDSRVMFQRSFMKIKKVAGALGAEISGVDLKTAIKPELAKEIRHVFLQSGVIFMRNQALSSQQFMNFALCMGEPIEYPFVKGFPGFPQIIEVKKLKHEKHNFGGIWHSDTTYLDSPPMGSMLLSKEIPPYGGDTLFACQYSAYEALSDTMQRMLSGLKGINTSAKADVSKTREDRIKSDGKEASLNNFINAHPIVRTHPETGRKALYVNVAHTAGIEGLTEAESAPLLAFLFQHQIKPEFTCRWAWEPNTLAFWDNRCTQHNPINDYHGFRRVLHRITLHGDKPM